MCVLGKCWRRENDGTGTGDVDLGQGAGGRPLNSVSCGRGRLSAPQRLSCINHPAPPPTIRSDGDRLIAETDSIRFRMRFHFDGHSMERPTASGRSPGSRGAETRGGHGALTQVPPARRDMTRLIGSATDGLHASLNCDCCLLLFFCLAFVGPGTDFFYR